MAISRLCSGSAAQKAGQVLFQRDLALLGLEEHLSGSAVVAGTNFAGIPAGSLKAQQAAFGARIITEAARAVAAEAANTAAINAEISANNTDHASATADRALVRAEVTSSLAIGATRDAAVATEIRGGATTSHNTLKKVEDLLDIETARTTAILNASNADYDTFVETVALITSVDTANDSAFAAHVLSNNGFITGSYLAYVTSNDAAIASEVSARTSADTALATRCTTLEAFDTRVADEFTVVSASSGCVLAFGSKAPQLTLQPDGDFVKVLVDYKS